MELSRRELSCAQVSTCATTGSETPPTARSGRRRAACGSRRGGRSRPARSAASTTAPCRTTSCSWTMCAPAPAAARRRLGTARARAAGARPDQPAPAKPDALGHMQPMLLVHGARSAVSLGRRRCRPGTCKLPPSALGSSVSELCAGAGMQGFVEMDNPHDRVKIAFQKELLEASCPAPAPGLRWGRGRHFARR